MNFKDLDDIKLYIHNLNKNQEYKLNNTWLKIYDTPDGKFLSTKINDVQAHIPLDKFNKIIENMDGKCSHNGVYFNLKKKSNREGNIKLEIKDEEGNIANDEFLSIHYNAKEHLQLIQHLRNEQEYIVIGIDDKGKNLTIQITNDSIINKTREHYEAFVFNKSLENFDLFKSKIPAFLKYVFKETNQKIILHNKTYIENSLGLIGMFNDDNTFDFENIVSRKDYTDFLINKNTMGNLFDRSHQRTSDLINFYTNNESLNSLKEIIEKNKNESKNLEVSLIKFDDKISDYSFISEKHFKEENQDLLINFMKDHFNFNFISPSDKSKIEAAFLYANKNNLIKVVDYMLNEFKESGRPFYLNNYGASVLTINLQKNHIELIEKTFELYTKKQFSGDSVVFQSNLISRDLLIDSLKESTINIELKEKIIDNLGLTKFKELILENNSFERDL